MDTSVPGHRVTVVIFPEDILAEANLLGINRWACRSDSQGELNTEELNLEVAVSIKARYPLCRYGSRSHVRE